jgi:hypothetical protein
MPESPKDKILALLSLIQKSASDAILEYEKRGYDAPDPHAREPHPFDAEEDHLDLTKAIRVLEGACQLLCSTLAPPMHTVIGVSPPSFVLAYIDVYYVIACLSSVGNEVSWSGP